MQKESSWRELLKDIIRNPAERERIATEVGVHPLTLQRWTSGESIPRPHNLKQLLAALPKQYRDQFHSLLEEDPLLFAQAHEDALPPGLPPALVNEPGLPPALSPTISSQRPGARSSRATQICWPWHLSPRNSIHQS